MAKFSLDPLPAFDFGRTAFLYLDCNTPAFEMADDLNHLYRLALRRQADMPLREADWPLFHYADSARYLNYIFLEVPPTSEPLPFLRAGAKLLVVQGRGAETTVEAIEAELYSTAPRTDLLDADLRFARVHYYHEHLFSSAVIRFSDDDAAAASSRRRKSLKGSAALAAVMVDMIDYLSLHGLSRDWN